jgi:hypothetical protein
MKNNMQPDFSALMNILGKSDKASQQEQAKRLIDTLDETQHRQLNDILQDKNKIDALLKSSAAQQIINKLKSGNNGQHQ